MTGVLQPGIKMGGDDFIDIWVYVVLHAQLRNLPRYEHVLNNDSRS